MNIPRSAPRLLALALVPALLALGATSASATPASPDLAGIYAADFVSTAAFGTDLNESGDVIGTSYPDTGCGPFCLPPLETVVWRDDERIVLPTVPGLSGITVKGINAGGWIAGFAGFPGTITHAVVWKPVGQGYQAIDLGTLPGTNVSDAIGIDDQNRAVGWSMTSNFPPTKATPFVWTEQTGMVDLGTQGFPVERPLGLSPVGSVATAGFWYRLGDASSVVPMPAPPSGFTLGADATGINDVGDQGRFLISTGAEHPLFLFRFHHEGTWQQVSFTGIKNTIYGMGSINEAEDITATVVGAGVVAPGPNGLAQPLVDLLSPAYKDRTITFGGPITESGEILARIMVGRSVRLMRMVPAQPCASSCLRVTSIQMKGQFVEDPSNPDHCAPDLDAFNRVQAKVTVTTETGAKVGGATVQGRFLDDYWTSDPVSGTTNAQGVVTFKHQGPCGVGAVAFLVERVTKGSRILDRTVGSLTGWVIPQ